MAQNYSKNEPEYKKNTKTVILQNYLDYSNTADISSMQVQDLGVHSSDKVEESDKQKSQILSFEFLSTDIANRIEDELAKFWTSKTVIRSLIREINKQNSYNFIKNMLTISDSRTVLGDIRNYLSYYELRHVLQSILAAAEDLELSDSSKFRLLLKEYKTVSQICLNNSNKTVDKKMIEIVNARIERLFEEMSKHTH